VVIVTRDRPELLARAIASVRDQCPVIVVDDGSRDIAAVEKAVTGAACASLWRSPSGGPSAGRNYGVSLARTLWVRFLDDDDVLVWPAMQDMAREIDAADALTCDAATADQWGFALHGSERVYTSQIAVRKQAFTEVQGFDDLIRYMEEADLLDRFVRAGKTVKHVGTIGVVRSGHVGSRPACLGGSSGESREDVQARRREVRAR
jgi:glycosyltransferase involved in cell wall biosynthesis